MGLHVREGVKMYYMHIKHEPKSYVDMKSHVSDNLQFLVFICSLRVGRRSHVRDNLKFFVYVCSPHAGMDACKRGC